MPTAKDFSLASFYPSIHLDFSFPKTSPSFFFFFLYWLWLKVACLWNGLPLTWFPFPQSKQWLLKSLVMRGCCHWWWSVVERAMLCVFGQRFYMRVAQYVLIYDGVCLSCMRWPCADDMTLKRRRRSGPTQAQASNILPKSSHTRKKPPYIKKMLLVWLTNSPVVLPRHRIPVQRDSRQPASEFVNCIWIFFCCVKINVFRSQARDAWVSAFWARRVKDIRLNGLIVEYFGEFLKHF